MTVLTILGVIIVACAILYALIALDTHCLDKFGHRFMTKSSFWIVVAGMLFLIFGHSWYLSALKNNGDSLNGIVLMILGGIFLVGLIIWNVKHSNVLYGSFGSLIQMSIFGVIGYFGIYVFVIFIALYFFAMCFSRPVWVMNK